MSRLNNIAREALGFLALAVLTTCPCYGDPPDDAVEISLNFSVQSGPTVTRFFGNVRITRRYGAADQLRWSDQHSLYSDGY